MGSELVRVEEIQREVAPVLQRAGELQIITPEDYEGAADFLKTVKGAEKRVVDFFAPMVAANLAATRATNAAKAQVLDPLTQAEAAIKNKQLSWSAEQERIRRAEEARLNAIEQERARKEREKAEAAARLQREKELAAQREADAARAAAAKAKNAADRERLQKEAEARQAEASAAAAKAEAQEERAAGVVATAGTVASVAPEVKGQSIRKTWKARLVNLQSIIDAAATPNNPTYSGNTVARSVLMFNEMVANNFAKATKGAVGIPGVEMYEETTLASTSK